jgi:hypothetical protein
MNKILRAMNKIFIFSCDVIDLNGLMLLMFMF